MMIYWDTDVNAPGCPGQIVDEETGETLLIQIDWDYPATAETFGWDKREIQKIDGTSSCDHDGTDGTIDCSCGVTTDDFIDAARDWLQDNDGAMVEDPGYFQAD